MLACNHTVTNKWITLCSIHLRWFKLWTLPLTLWNNSHTIIRLCCLCFKAAITKGLVEDQIIHCIGLKGTDRNAKPLSSLFIHLIATHHSGSLKKHAMSNPTSIITCHSRQCDHCLTPITGQALYHMTNSQRVTCGLGGLLNVAGYQSEEGPDSKVWRYRWTICWCGFSFRSAGQWVRGLLPSRLPCLLLNRAFYLQINQLRNMTQQ